MTSYEIFKHWKQGDDLNNCLENNKGDSKKAIAEWADDLEGCAIDLRRMLEIFKDKEFKILQADTHYIAVDGDKEALEKCVAEGLINKEEFEDEEDEEKCDCEDCCCDKENK